MAVDRSRLAAALAYRQAEEERRRRMMESVPVPGAELPTPAPSQNLRRDLENLSIGIGEGLTNQLEGVKGIVTDPIGAARGAYEGVKAVVRDPSIIADALRYTAQKARSGPLGAGEVIGEMIGPRKTGPMMAELDVYHGTPHRFPATEANPLGEFDASKIGTGEGAQAYGHGIYYAESPDVARSYATMNQASAPSHASFIRLRDQAPQGSAEWKHYDNLAKEGLGSLYKADLPDEMIDRMLDWDKPLGQQSQSVQKALQKIGRFDPDRTGMEVLRDLRKELDQGLIDPEITKRVVKTPELTAEETKILNDLSQKRRAYLGSLPEPELKILHRLENQLNKRNKEMMKAEKLAAINLAKNLNLGEEKMFMEGPALTSAVLRQAGIPGTSYLDAGSRGQGGSGTRNFVVFPGEEKKVRILERK